MASVDSRYISVKGMSAAGGKKLVIINQSTFEVGEGGEIRTPNGRVYIRCLEIKANSVIVEINGQKQELRFSE